jgi:hypothetical protein
MHYLFEIQLMTEQIVGRATPENRADYAWMVKTQHVRRYLVNYYRDHAVLPTGRHRLGMTRPLNLEVGMVDLDAIRQEIRADSEKWKGLKLEMEADIEGACDYPLHTGIDAGVGEQTAGRQPGRVIFDLRQALTRRGNKG